MRPVSNKLEPTRFAMLLLITTPQPCLTLRIRQSKQDQGPYPLREGTARELHQVKWQIKPFIFLQLIHINRLIGLLSSNCGPFYDWWSLDLPLSFANHKLLNVLLVSDYHFLHLLKFSSHHHYLINTKKWCFLCYNSGASTAFRYLLMAANFESAIDVQVSCLHQLGQVLSVLIDL